ncbi:hypothetical protein [Orenia marismortui]|uniref:hypothetical protein n=1 Tax=Orenia marismortui TaxID=46469 RepID=UPI00037C0C1A|nr:hypothetical protein [Orenia marismortui]
MDIESNEVDIDFDNLDIDIDEKDFLQKLANVISKREEEIEMIEEEKEKEKREEMEKLESMECIKGMDFEEILEDLRGEFVTIIIKSGGRCNGVECCCAYEGLLCQLGRDLILLIASGRKIFIPIDAIAAVIEED